MGSLLPRSRDAYPKPSLIHITVKSMNFFAPPSCTWTQHWAIVGVGYAAFNDHVVNFSARALPRRSSSSWYYGPAFHKPFCLVSQCHLGLSDCFSFANPNSGVDNPFSPGLCDRSCVFLGRGSLFCDARVVTSWVLGSKCWLSCGSILGVLAFWVFGVSVRKEGDCVGSGKVRG
jgi:hypothetical protein